MPSTGLASSENEQTNVQAVEEVEGPRRADYYSMTLVELKALAKEKGIEGYSNLKKAELIEKLG